jgi:anti-sigma factor RsiW
MSEPVTELELEAYLDGALDSERCLAVEEHLARTPAAAARMMADLGARTALRLAQPALAANAALTSAAVALNQRLSEPRRPLLRLLQSRRLGLAGLAAAITAIVILPVPPVVQAAPPVYVSDAVQAFQTGLLRADMPSQIEAPHLDARDVQRFTRIRVPVLPAGWRVTDVQLFPSDEGPALQIMIRTARNQIVSIFAVRSAVRAPSIPETTKRGNTNVAYWRHGDMAYALTGVAAPAALEFAARDLADNSLT